MVGGGDGLGGRSGLGFGLTASRPNDLFSRECQVIVSGWVSDE